MIDFDDLDTAEAHEELSVDQEQGAPAEAPERQGAAARPRQDLAGELATLWLPPEAARCQRERAKPPVEPPGPCGRSRRRSLPGIFYGLPFPWSPGSLKALGPDWLTEAFHAAGTIATSSEVVAIKGLRCLGFRMRARMVLVEVEFRKDSGEAFHKDLLVKFPCFDLLGADPCQDRNAPGRSPLADHFAEVNFYRLFEALSPFCMPRFYYGDVSDQSENFIVITEWVPVSSGALQLAQAQACFIRGYHGMYLGSNPSDRSLFMSQKRKEWQTWTLRPAEGRKHYLESWGGGLLTTSGDGEQDMAVSPSKDDQARWTLLEAQGGTGHHFLRSRHQTYLASLRDGDQTLYMSPNMKDWEKWRLVPLESKEVRSAAGARHLNMQDAGYDTFHAMISKFAKLAALPVSGQLWGAATRLDEPVGTVADNALIEGPATWANRSFLEEAGLAQDFICTAGDALFPSGTVTNISMQRYRSMLVTTRSNLDELTFWCQNALNYRGFGMDYFDLDSAFESCEDGAPREGLRHWDSLSLAPLGWKLWRLFSFARFDVLLHHREELLETFTAAYHQSGGPLLKFEVLHAHFILAACLDAVDLLKAIPEFYACLPRCEWASIASLQDTRLVGHQTSQGSLWVRLKSFANIFLLLEHFDIKTWFYTVMPMAFVGYAIGPARRLQGFQVRAEGTECHASSTADGPLMSFLPGGCWVVAELYRQPVASGGRLLLQIRYPIPSAWVEQEALEPAPATIPLVTKMETRDIAGSDLLNIVSIDTAGPAFVLEDIRAYFDMDLISCMYNIRRFYTGCNPGGMAEISMSMLHSRYVMFHSDRLWTALTKGRPRIVRGSFLAQRRSRSWWPAGYEDWAHHSFMAFEDGSIADVTADQFDTVPQLWWPADRSRYAFDFKPADEARRIRNERVGQQNWARLCEEEDAAEGRSRYPWWTVEWHTTMRLPPKGGLVLRHNEPVQLPPVVKSVEVGEGRPAVTFRRITGEHELEVWLVEGLFRAEEADRLVKCCEARQGFQQSLTKSTGGQIVTDSRRTSSTCPIFFPHLCEDILDEMREAWGGSRADEELEAANSAAALCAGALEVDVSRIEPLQMVKYTPGQHYLPHLDAHQEPERLSSFCGEQRLQTLLVFMNNVPEADGGGHLHFPHLGLRILPRAGSAVLWSNVKPGSCEPNPESLHEGVAPLTSGKVAMNVWIVDRPLTPASIASGRRRSCGARGRGRATARGAAS